MAQRKLGRPAKERQALIRNQVTNLIWYGRIETTEARAKEVRRMAERTLSGVLGTMRTPPTSVLCTMVGETIFRTALSPGIAASSSSEGRAPRTRRLALGGVSAPERASRV